MNPVMKMRSPSLHWVLLVGSFGLYAPLWLYHLSCDIERLKKGPAKLCRISLLLVWVWYLFFLGSVMMVLLGKQIPQDFTEKTMSVLNYVAIAILCSFVCLQIKIAHILNEFIKTRISSLVVFLLTFCMLLSLPLLQFNYNKLVLSKED